MRLCLRRTFPPLWFTQGNLELPLPLNSLDLHEKMKKMNQMKFWTGPTSSFPNIFETMDSMLIGL